MRLYIKVKKRTNVNVNGDEEDSDEAEEDNGVDEYGSATCLHVAKLDHSASGWNLKQQTWAQQHEQHHRYDHWTPIRH
ncbi:hypothetical protein PanWU01x14_028910 [Parasponia andersonii]|uniref:Uncharacterized protein n=1 Tax=Parasponia andersonii TaxID=3476 RepID=A0A2P5DVG9_PARAD|nr:hypothetical protein PanWU01x14_028910 [Parasponia andersonii]